MKISVCIPTYNQALYIKKAITSALQQTVIPFEIIVYNDCSTDNTPEVLSRLSSAIPQLIVVTQPQNQGIAKNTDDCLRRATGDLIVRLDSDDYLAPTYIQQLAELLVKHPDAGYAHCAVQEVDQNGNFLNKRKLFRKEIFQTSDEALKAAVHGYRVAANILMFKKEALVKVDYLKGRPNFGEDFHLTASISAAGFGNVYHADILAFYRVWVDTGKVRQKRKLTEIDGLRSVFDEVLTPAFRKRGWPLNSIEKSKTNFACIQADCLSWKVYNKAEKIQLVTQLEKLSSAPKARITANMYLHGFGKLLSGYSLVTALSKKIAKKIFMGFNS